MIKSDFYFCAKTLLKCFSAATGISEITLKCNFAKKINYLLLGLPFRRA